TTLTSAWNDLASPDAGVAFRAARALIEAPAQALPILSKHLRPPQPMNTKQIERLLANLDSKVSADPEKAMQELERSRDLIEGALLRFLAQNPAAGARARAELLLTRAAGPVADADRLRQLRAVEVLESIGNTDAKQLLRKFADSAPDRLSREAVASLRRLE